jgi:hypothetical protein
MKPIVVLLTLVTVLSLVVASTSYTSVRGQGWTTWFAPANLTLTLQNVDLSSDGISGQIGVQINGYWPQGPGTASIEAECSLYNQYSYVVGGFQFQNLGSLWGSATYAMYPFWCASNGQLGLGSYYATLTVYVQTLECAWSQQNGITEGCMQRSITTQTFTIGY